MNNSLSILHYSDTAVQDPIMEDFPDDVSAEVDWISWVPYDPFLPQIQ